jgi:hypothetical protein
MIFLFEKKTIPTKLMHLFTTISSISPEHSTSATERAQRKLSNSETQEKNRAIIDDEDHINSSHSHGYYQRL